MFVEFKNLNVAFRREFPLAIVYLNKCDGERFLREQGIAKSGSFSSFIPLIAIVDKGFISFLDYKQICFEVDGNILPYDDFCKYELPEGQVFKMVFDNGYSYYGSEPFKGDAKKYADTAIKVAEKLGYLWFSWTMGFRLNNLLNVDVVYGKDESYSVVSNT